MANKKEYAELKWAQDCFVALFILILISLGLMFYNDYKINNLIENDSVKINDGRTCYSEKCYMDVKNNIQVGPCMMSEVDCSLFETKFALVADGEGGLDE